MDQNILCLSYYHCCFALLIALHVILPCTESSSVTYICCWENKLILSKPISIVCCWATSAINCMYWSFVSSLSKNELGDICGYPATNVGIPTALKVIVTCPQTIRFRRILYSILHRKRFLFVAWEIWCILTENILLFKRVVLLYVTKCLKQWDVNEAYNWISFKVFQNDKLLTWFAPPIYSVHDVKSYFLQCLFLFCHCDKALNFLMLDH